MPDPYQQLIDDLVAEQRYLDGQLADLPDEIWQNDTPCRGWMVRDVIAHLAEVDESATNVATGALKSMSGGDRSEDGTRSALQDSSRHMTRTQLVDWWRAARDRMEIALRARDGRDRLPWAGPPMSARSFATARLMECWSHGLDALDGASVEPIHSDRLQHIAHLGYITREFAYRTRGMEPNAEPLRVQLTLPSSALPGPAATKMHRTPFPARPLTSAEWPPNGFTTRTPTSTTPPAPPRSFSRSPKPSPAHPEKAARSRASSQLALPCRSCSLPTESLTSPTSVASSPGRCSPTSAPT